MLSSSLVHMKSFIFFSPTFNVRRPTQMGDIQDQKRFYLVQPSKERPQNNTQRQDQVFKTWMVLQPS